jgi:predicted N-acetyltransferase YhbS
LPSTRRIRRLITHLLDQPRAKGASGVHRVTGTANKRAIGFYGRIGFRPRRRNRASSSWACALDRADHPFHVRNRRREDRR